MKVKPIGKLPFVYAPIDTPNNPGDLPNELPFSVEIRNGVFSQLYQKNTEDALNKAYSIGSAISGQMDDEGNGKEYADEFLTWMVEEVGSFVGKKVLEIGCGTGYLMSRLNALGAETQGVEPGESALYGIEKYGVDIKRAFFDPYLFSVKFDYIIFYGVLEHMLLIEKFLSDVTKLLLPEGCVLLAVPNCETQIRMGDISMLFAEHWSYFTERSLLYTLLRNGFDGRVSISKLGNVLFASANFQNVSFSNKEFIAESEWLFFSFIDNYEKQKQKVKQYFEKVNYDKSIGVYVPWRIVNWLNIIGEVIDPTKLRFIDDSPILRDTYFPGFKNPIESFDDFLRNPSSRVLIASLTFEDEIKDKIKRSNFTGKVDVISSILK